MRKTHLLDDIPSSRDELGAHERVAGALADLVDRESGGKAVAIEGSWGSGKSTIVEILRQRFPERVFVFDAWSHEGDPLRRAFLNELIDFFVETGKLDADSSERDKAMISGELTESSTTTHYPVTPIRLLFGLSLLGVPLGVTLLQIAHQPPKLDETLRLAAYCLTLAPAIVVGLGAIGSFFRQLRERTKGQKIEWRFGEFELLFNHLTPRDETEQHRTVDATSVEFAEIFSEKLSQALESEPLLLVVDNLDRIPRDSAIEVWSTLRVYVEECARQDAAWTSLTWLVVPYDRTAMERVWASQSGQIDSPQDFGLADIPNDQIESEGGARPGSAKAEALVDAYLQKTFQIRYRVPPLLLSNWRDYFLALLRQAFPEHDESERRAVYQIVRQWRAQIGALPTPRELKLFANDLVAIYAIWGDEFPLHHMAYYRVLRCTDEDIPSSLTKGAIPRARYADFLAEGIERDIGALHFVRERDEAAQLVLDGPIREAFRAGNGARLRELSELGIFWPVFENLAVDLASEDASPSELASSGSALLESGLHLLSSPSDARDTVSRFCTYATDVEDWGLLDEDCARGIAAFAEILNSDSTSRRLFEQASASSAALVADKTVVARVDSWAAGLLILLRRLDEIGFPRSESVMIPGAPDVVVPSLPITMRHQPTQQLL